MPFLDRELQRRILEIARDDYPSPVATSDIEQVLASDEATILRNIAYLVEHRLLEGKMHLLLGAPPRILDVTITANGLDFLEDDGGLTAILGTVTIRFADDQFRDLLAARIEKLDGPPSAKAELLRALKRLPAEALAEAARQSVLMGLDALPSLDAVRKWLLPG